MWCWTLSIVADGHGDRWSFVAKVSYGPNARMLVPHRGRLQDAASPLRLSQNPVVYRRPPPQLGADTAEVCEWLLGDGAEPLDSIGRPEGSGLS
jgi:hypothetical protein